MPAGVVQTDNTNAHDICITTAHITKVYGTVHVNRSNQNTEPTHQTILRCGMHANDTHTNAPDDQIVDYDINRIWPICPARYPVRRP